MFENGLYNITVKDANLYWFVFGTAEVDLGQVPGTVATDPGVSVQVRLDQGHSVWRGLQGGQ